MTNKEFIIEKTNNGQTYFHFVGIGGIGMSALALCLIDKGFKISGSDLCSNNNIEKLINKGAKINIGHKAENIVDVTFKHIDEEHGPDDFYEMPELGIRLPESEYWTSEERGLLIGIECATTTANFDDMSKAVDKGKTRKTWITEAEDRVRKTHDEVHGVEMPINQPFLVGNSYLLFPGDLTYDPEEKEVANCRCHAEYF